MAGIYVHIPFCRKACHYCNFHFSTSTALQNDFISALLKESALQQQYLAGSSIETIYFGGGTPSLLPKSDLVSILSALRNHYDVSPSAEITLEANPDDFSLSFAVGWRKAGFNRLSIGIQSFFEEDLRWMNRAHDALQATNCIDIARSAGFENFTIDLIYGTPGLTDEKWETNVQTAISLNIPHLSCYALTVEPGTALQKMVELKKKENVDPEKQARQFSLLMKWLVEAGYEHYEISNFAKPGFRSLHNSNYWKGVHYLGLGPSAHSFNGIERKWNIANNALYIQSILNGEIPAEKELLTTEQQLNEYIMTALRTSDGLDLDHVTTIAGYKYSALVLDSVRKYVGLGHAVVNGQRITLTPAGKLFADGIASDLFVMDNPVKSAERL
ncbi:MAG: radical SAM family heme chaperone HemW [Gemmatimonadaceae bacterium]|nr:radical SAM family heme chaperone HemW [Chitinophagaceae bacterium]